MKKDSKNEATTEAQSIRRKSLANYGNFCVAVVSFLKIGVVVVTGHQKVGAV